MVGPSIRPKPGLLFGTMQPDKNQNENALYKTTNDDDDDQVVNERKETFLVGCSWLGEYESERARARMEKQHFLTRP